MARKRDTTYVGQRTPKHDAVDMVTGRAVYAADVHMTGMLYGRILRSPHPHARILGIDTTRALALAGVVDVITAAQTPATGLFATDEVCFQGQMVAAVAAEDPDIAREALSLIRVKYKRLPAVTDPLRALRHDAPLVRCDVPPGDVRDSEGRLLPNAASHSQSETGDVDAALALADAVVEAEYHVPFFHQVYMEPNAATARVEANGRISIWTGPQGIFSIRDKVAGSLGIPHGRIRVIATIVGGGFGAKNAAFVEAHAALLATRTGRPVQVRTDREEVFLDGRPAPGCVIRLKTAARKDGTLTAVDGWMVWDRGWVGGGGRADRLRGLYRVPNVRLESYGVRTNKTSPGAYRAPGAPQTAFARESNMDLLARELGMDPVELRLKNAVRKGDRSLAGTPLAKDWFRQTIHKAVEVGKWGRRRLKPNQGRGIACGEWTNASGPVSVFIAVNEDGTLAVLTGQVDITGLHTVVAQVVAEELGVPPERITVTQGTTDTVPYTSLSAGSKATYVTGTAAREAGRQARERILEEAAAFLEVSPGGLRLEGGRVKVRGSSRSVGLAELAASALNTPKGPLSGQWVLAKLQTHPSYSVDIATVEVDPETGRVRLLELLAVQDVGRALNPLLVEGQMQGGVTQAIGLGMMEEFRYGRQGHMLNPNLLDYAIPTFRDMPKIQTAILEIPCPDGPYGAKGVGEPPIIPGAAAIANAVHDAVGVRVTTTPVTPERVVAALRERAD